MIPFSIGPIERIISRYDAAVAAREGFRSVMQDCYRYAIPDRDLWTDFAPGQRKGSELYDSTAIVAVQDFASSLQARICPSWRTWSKLVAGPGLPKDVRENDELAMYLEETTDQLFGYINHSNFALKSHEAFQDLSVGTGAITLELNERGNGLSFDSIPAPHLAIEEGPNGMVETVFQDRKSAVSVLARTYPGISLPEKWQKMLVDKPGELVSYQVGSIFDPKRREYHLVVFCKAEKQPMYYRLYGETSPVIVFRWTTNPGEIWGRGPVMRALPDIKTLNKVVEFILRDAAMSISPPITAVTDGVVNPYTLVLQPNAVIPVMSNDTSNPSLRELTRSSRPDLAQFILAEMRQSVRNMMFSDPRRREGPVQSATEVLIEDREFTQRIGSSYGRLQTEFVERVLNRSVALLKSIGKMPDFKIDGREITLKHLSPLARAQDQEELLGLQTAVAMAAPFGPEALQMAVKTEDIGEWIFKKAGVDASVLRSDAERKQMMQTVAQQAQAAIAAQTGQAPAAA